MRFSQDKHLGIFTGPWRISHVGVIKNIWSYFRGLRRRMTLLRHSWSAAEAVNMTNICRYVEGFYSELIIPANREKIGKVF